MSVEFTCNACGSKEPALVGNGFAATTGAVTLTIVVNEKNAHLCAPCVIRAVRESIHRTRREPNEK